MFMEVGSLQFEPLRRLQPVRLAYAAKKLDPRASRAPSRIHRAQLRPVRALGVLQARVPFDSSYILAGCEDMLLGCTYHLSRFKSCHVQHLVDLDMYNRRDECHDRLDVLNPVRRSPSVASQDVEKGHLRSLLSAIASALLIPRMLFLASSCHQRRV